MTRPLVGISACLLGQNVRYDGGHKHHQAIFTTLDPHVEWMPVCPEVEMGLSVPREPMRLEGSPPQLFTHHTRQNHTSMLGAWSVKRLKELEQAQLCGYIFKSKSPSCGLHNIPLFDKSGQLTSREGRGLFASALVQRWPALPVAEEKQLETLQQQQDFLQLIFHYQQGMPA